jgi:CHAD domain-containing protein
MKPARLFRRWCRQQAALLKDLVRLLRTCRVHGTAADIHQLRVVTRRLRQVVRLGAAWYGRKATRTFRDWSRSVSLATDALRDADVTLEWLASQSPQSPIASRMTRDRARQYRQARRRLPPIPLRLRQVLSRPVGGRKHEQRLHERFGQLQIRFQERLRRQAPRFFKLPLEDQHDFRRLVRRWRYLRELELPSKQRAKDDLLRRLFDLQSVLGERQNMQLVRQTLSQLGSAPEAATLRVRLELEIRRLERKIRVSMRWLAT